MQRKISTKPNPKTLKSSINENRGSNYLRKTVKKTNTAGAGYIDHWIEIEIGLQNSSKTIKGL